MTLEHLDTIISFVVILTGVSLIVTILTQTATGLLALRGSNLRWGIATLVKELEPSLADHAWTISQKVLHHPLISDSTLSRFDGLIGRWKLASAVRKDELIDILHKLAQPPAAAAATWQTQLYAALQQLDPEPAENLVLAAPAIRQLFPGDPAKAEQVIAQMTAAAEHLSGSIDQWFDSVMDRVSQRFVVKARVLTIIFSVLVAFGLHLDTLRLLTQLSSDAELRARLIASTESLTKKADEILATSPNASPAIYVTAMRQLISAHPDELAGIAQPAGFDTMDGGKQWLEAQLKTAKIEGIDQWEQQYEQLVPQAALRSAADGIQSILKDKLQFQLIPDPYPTPFYNYWTPSWLHFWGVLASAALLSLGAPFWFNMLRTLSNLRPVLATKEEAEKKAAAST